MVCIYIFLIMGYIFNIGSLINLLFNIDWNDFEIVSKEPDDYCTPLQHRVLRTITCASKIKLKQKVPLSTPYLRSSWDGDRRKLRLLLWGLILQVWANKVSLCKAEFLKICLSRTGYYSDLKIDARHRGLSVFLPIHCHVLLPANFSFTLSAGNKTCGLVCVGSYRRM